MNDRPARHTSLVDRNGQPGSHLEDLVVISGFSGAGKSLAMQVFEDAGYFCVDNLPAEMIRTLADLFTHAGSKVERAAVVSDLRGGTYFEKLAVVLDELEQAGVKHRVMFLCADEETLLTRYKETRRRHPLAQEGNVADGIRREAELLAPVRDRADVLVDTTGLSAAMLRRKVAGEMLRRAQPGRLAVTFLSFGFKHGPARDADLLFDVRFLPNPHYEADLRPLTGFDSRIVDYVARDGRLEEFYGRVVPLLEYLLPQYVAEGKSHLVIAIGCTGGRHRSVTIAEELVRRFARDERFIVDVQHRDVERAPVRG
jgi:RNase adapter protein RapZ